MPVLKLDNASLAFGNHPLLDHANLVIEPGQKIAIVGRNGAGKSTLMRVISGQEKLDDGEFWLDSSTRVAMLDQRLPELLPISLYDYVAEGLGEPGRTAVAYNKALLGDSGDLDQLTELMNQHDAWNVDGAVRKILNRLDLNPEALLKTLSGGWRRRVALARALVTEPTLLLLDEPTNHLDILMIESLEAIVKEFRGAVLFVTHDRNFLESVADHILELDRGALRMYPGSFSQYQASLAERLEIEERHWAEFDKKLSQEEAWIRQGIKARRTRNEGRVRNLEKLRVERKARRERQGNVDFSIEQAQSSGKLVAELTNVSYAFSDKPIVNDFSGLIMRGDRIGVLGPNGVGKSTFVRLLLGQLEAQQGSIRLGTNLEVAYFDQLRAQLDPEKSVLDNLAEGRDFISINGQNRHVISYLQDFLFSPERVRSPVSALSGGEANRLLLAKLFSLPSNLMVLDEPTNDLDIETLELLEQILADYQGTLILVTHDRAFMDNVATSLIAFEGSGRVQSYVGGFDDWRRMGGRFEAEREADAAKLAAKQTAAPVESKTEIKQAKKLSYKLKRELDALPGEIATLEETIAGLEEQLGDPDLYAKSPEKFEEISNKVGELTSALEIKLDRWVELESM